MSFYLCLISIILIVILISVYCYLRDHYEKQARALTVKATCTLIAVSTCLYGIIKTGAGATRWLLFVGLCICLVADVTLGVNFVAGMLVFMFAHFCFIIYFLSLTPPKGYSILLFVIFYAFAVGGFRKFFPKLGKQVVAFMIYPAILITMLSIAAMLPFSLNSIGAVCIALGAALFAVSDMILGQITLGEFSKIKDRMVFYLYYSGIYLLAVSTFYM